MSQKEPAASARRMVVYTLKPTGSAGITGAMSILRTMFPGAEFAAGTEPDKMVAFAKPADHAAIKAAVEELAKEEPPETAPKMVVYTLEATGTAGITGALSVLRTMFPEVQFAVGTEPNQMVAFARPADHERIKAAVAELSKEEPPEKAKKVVVYTMESASATAASYSLSILRTMFPDAQFSAGAEPDKVVVLARPKDHDAIKKAVAEMSQKEPAATARRMVVYTLETTGTSGISGVLTVLRTMFPQAEFVAGTEPNKLVAFARPAEHERIKAAVEEISKEEPPEKAAKIAVYTIKTTSPMARYYTISMLRAMFPDAQFSTGAERDKLVVLARPADQAKIKQVVEELSKRDPPEKAARAVVYDVPSVGASAAITFLSSVFHDAEFSAGADPDRLVVWAKPEDHEVIKTTVEQIEAAGVSETKRVLAVYPMRSHDAQSLSKLIDPALRRNVQIVLDPQRDRLLVWAEPKQQEAIRKTIEQFQKETAKAGEPTAQVYRFQWADPRAAYSVLGTLVPSAEIALDTGANSLVVSATPEDHARIKATIDEMEKQGSGEGAPRLQVHRLKSADPTNLLTVLQGLYRAQAGVQLSLDSNNDAIVAVASPAQHDTIRKLIEQLEKGVSADAAMRLETYPVEEGASPQAIIRMLTALLERQGGKAELTYEPRSNLLVAIARPDQHTAIRETLERVKGEERTLEIVQLDVVDPSTAETAVERLFGDGGYWRAGRSPTVDVDYTSQQLLIRATKEQHAKIRDLLVKMGETSLAVDPSGDTRRSRVITFEGDLNAALEEIQRVWPKLRANPIQVVSPPAEIRIQDWRTQENRKSAKERLRPAQGPPAGTTKDVPKNEAGPWRPSPAKDRPAGAAKTAPDDSQWRPSRAKDEPPAAAKPVIIIPGDGTLTITSEDPAALSQLEGLLRMLSRQKGAVGRNFNIFILKNAKASEISSTLQRLFRSMTIPGRGTSSVVLVPDDRLNAIVAYANRTDRATIENLLKILDSAEVPESMAADRLHLIPIKNTSAVQMQAKLQDLFRGQVEALSVEDVTNSVVVMAAEPMVEEIKAVVEVLDKAAGSESSRGVKIIPLKKASSERVEKALDIILRDTSRRRRGR